MSHELRTPLNAIMGFSQLSVLDKEIPEEQRSNAKQVYSAGEHLLQLINDVLDLAQIEAGKVSLQVEPIMPFPVVNECFSLIKSLAEKRNITLSYDIDDCQQVHVYADKMRLKQCLLNLISNAVKYNVDGGSVKVIFSKKEHSVDISVEDSGHGISAEKLEKMNGHIHYCKSQLKGACFVIQLPLANIDSLPKHVDFNQRYNPDISLPSFTDNKNILYIEDNLANIHLLSSLLKPYSQINLISYSDPFIGLYSIRTQIPDMVILDINLPGISGLDIVKLLKADALTQHIPVVALSASVMPYDIEKGMLAGFDEYLTKPLEIKRLIFVLNQFLKDLAA